MNTPSESGPPAPASPLRKRPGAARALLLLLCGAALVWGASLAIRRAELASEAALLKARLEAVRQQAEAADRLARALREKAAAARVALFKELESEAAELRELPFLRAVEYEILGRAEVKEAIRGIIRQHYSPEMIRQYAKLLAAAGLIPAGLDLEEAYLALMGEQIAAFYDQFRGRLIMLREADPRAFQTRIILVHELVHALQDQHFRLREMPLALKDNDDRALAASALIEGDATLVMNAFSARHMNPRNFGELLGGTLATPVKELLRAPRFLRETLLFPYKAGERFADYLHEQGGFEALSGAYASPPRSTTEILHPRLFGKIQIREDWPAPDVEGLGAPLQNTLGEFALRVWFDLWTGPNSGRSAAEGWRGDRILAYFGGADGVHTAWMTQWADRAEAEEFFALAKKALARRYDPGATAGGEDGPFSFDTPRAVRLARDGATVLLLDTGEPAVRERIEAALGVWGRAAGPVTPERAEPRAAR